MCCTFVYSVINLIWNKQYVFFILVVSDFDGPRSVTKYDRKWINSITDWQHSKVTTPILRHYLLKKRRSAKVRRKMANYSNKNLCFYCKRFNHRQEDCRTRIQDGQPCTDNRGRKYWPKRYTDENDTQGQGPTSPISALKSYVTPLLGSRSVLTQIILNLCLASLTTCSKIYDIFAPGEKVRPRVNVRTGNQTTSWLSLIHISEPTRPY